MRDDNTLSSPQRDAYEGKPDGSGIYYKTSENTLQMHALDVICEDKDNFDQAVLIAEDIAYSLTCKAMALSEDEVRELVSGYPDVKLPAQPA